MNSKTRVFPHWKRPILYSDWVSVLASAAHAHTFVDNTYTKAKQQAMPYWFVTKIARRRYQTSRRCSRIQRRMNRLTSSLIDLVHRQQD